MYFKGTVLLKSFRTTNRTSEFTALGVSRCVLVAAVIVSCAGCADLITRHTRVDLDLPPEDSTVTRPYQNLSCEELYAEIVRLSPKTYSTHPDFLDDPRNIAATSLGLIFHPAFAVWAYTATTGYLADQKVTVATEEIDRLRRENALKNCWVR
jgi:hypothetical protein